MKLFTQNMNDGDLDDLFRDAAAQYAPADRKEELWDRLVRKMDAGEPVKRKRPFRRYGALLALVAAGVAIWQYEARHAPESRPAATAPSEAPGARHLHPASAVPPATGEEETATTHALPSPEAAVKPAPPASALHPMTPTYGTFPATRQQRPAGRHLAEAISEPGVTGGPSSLTPFALPALSSFSLATPEKKEGSLNGRLALSPKRAQLSFSATPGNRATSPDKPHEKKSSRRAAPFHHWNVGLSLGPDWSSAAAHGWRTGIGGGLTLTYRLDPHWGLTTGVLIDKKLYDARPADYHPSSPLPPTLDVRSIAARCTVIDVPVNVSYSLWQQGSSRIFLSAGLSSFFMQEEKYSYDYKTAGGNWEKWSKEMYGKNQHIFSIVNIAPAYEKAGAHLSFQVEPYLKVPLQGIGYGKVKLLSTGVHLTISYGLH